MNKQPSEYDTELFYWCQKDWYTRDRIARLQSIQEDFYREQRARRAINLAIIVFAAMTLGVVIVALVR